MADALFAERSVADVRILETKMEADIEKKKRDMRIMVGERYRDLLEAADCVAKMKDNSSKLQELFVQLDNACNFEIAMKNLKESEEADRGKEDQSAIDRTGAYPVAVQIKILIDTPEQIWNSLENSLYLRASRLWDAASLINAHLQEVDMRASKIPLTFPLVSRQWDTIRHFNLKILEKTKDYLKNTDIADQVVAECLCAIMILEKIALEDVLKLFLSLRMQSLSKSLSIESNQINLSELLKDLCSIIRTTIYQISTVFFPYQNVPGLLGTIISELSASSNETNTFASNSLFSLYSEKTNMHVIHRHLPLNIQNHTPFLPKSEMKLPKDIIKPNVESWLSNAILAIKNGAARALTSLKNGSEIAVLRENLIESLEKETDSKEIFVISRSEFNWDEICSHLMDTRISIWDDIFRGVFRQASVQAISEAFKELSGQVETVVTPLVQSLQMEDAQDRAVSSYIWNSDSSESCIDGNTACRIDTLAIRSIADAFHKSLELIKSTALPLVMAKTLGQPNSRRGSKTPSPTFDLTDGGDHSHFERDGELFKKCFQDEYIKAVEKYQENLIILLKSIETQKPDVAIPQCTFIARVSKAIAIKVRELSIPTLNNDEVNKSAVITRWRQRNFGDKNAGLLGKNCSSDLEGAQQKLLEVHFSAISVWITETGNRFEVALKFGLENEDWTYGSRFLGIWEAVTIQTSDDSGSLQQYQMKLPVHASSYVTQSLFNLVSNLNKLVGFILEKQILTKLLMELTERIIRTFQTFLRDVVPSISLLEKAYLQIMFDFEFLIKVVDGCWSEGTDVSLPAKKSAMAVLSQIRQLIDPIDLINVSAHFSSNLDRFYYRTSVLFGGLLSLNLKPSEMKKNPSLHELHNTIAIAPHAPRFTMLLTSLPGTTLPSTSRSRGGLTTQFETKSTSTSKPRPRIHISVNSVANAAGAGVGSGSGGMNVGINPKDGSFSISGSVLSGVAGLVGAAQGVGQKGIFGGATAVFGALMGSGGLEGGERENVTARKF